MLTGNLEDIPWELREMFQYGANFRYHLKKEDTLEAIKLGLDCYIAPKIEYWSSRNVDGNNQQQLDNLQRWKAYMLEQCGKNFRIRSHHNAEGKRITDEKRMVAMKKLKKNVVICRVDKTTHNLCIMYVQGVIQVEIFRRIEKSECVRGYCQRRRK